MIKNHLKKVVALFLMICLVMSPVFAEKAEASILSFVGTLVGTVVGGPLGGAIGGAIGGVANGDSISGGTIGGIIAGPIGTIVGGAISGDGSAVGGALGGVLLGPLGTIVGGKIGGAVGGGAGGGVAGSGAMGPGFGPPIPFGGVSTKVTFCICTLNYLVEIDDYYSGKKIELLHSIIFSRENEFYKIGTAGVYVLGTYQQSQNQCQVYSGNNCQKMGNPIGQITGTPNSGVGTSKEKAESGVGGVINGVIKGAAGSLLK